MAYDQGSIIRQPLTAFLCHARGDVGEVRLLQQELHLRGLRTWRDVTNLAAGSYAESEAIEAIDHSDLFLMYLTPKMLERTFIWEVEVPAAIERWTRDSAFRIFPIFRGVTPDELGAHSTRLRLHRLSDFNGLFVPERGANDTSGAVLLALQEVANRALASVVEPRLLGMTINDPPPCLCLKTFEYTPPSGDLDLDLAWESVFQEPSTDEVRVNRLFPALYDVKDLLSRSVRSRVLRVVVQARLPAALAFGAIFPTTTDFTLAIEASDAVWRTDDVAVGSGLLNCDRIVGSGASDVAIVEVAVSRETSATVDRTVVASALSHEIRIRLMPQGGPNRLTVQDGSIGT